MTFPQHKIITDHALLRYLERVEGYDVHNARRSVERTEPRHRDFHVLEWLSVYAGVNTEAKRQALITPKLLAAIAAGAKAVFIGPVNFIIKGGSVVTVKTVEWRAMRPCLKKGTARARVMDQPKRNRRLSVRDAMLEAVE